MNVRNNLETRSAQVRRRLSHPVIDGDGHTLEFIPAFFDELKAVGGAGMVERYLSYPGNRLNPNAWYRQSWEERRDNWTPRNPWWVPPTSNTLDRATVTLPRLLRERMDELGLDFAMLYPTVGLSMHNLDDAEIRQICCRAFNRYYAKFWGEQKDRMAAVAMIPMHTPQEAIAELEYAVGTLGMKSIMIAGYVKRPIAAVQRKYPDMAKYAYRLDNFGIDSEHDYDPFWAKCVELKVAPACHEGGMGWGTRQSISNYMYNHIGHFASAAEALAKSLFFGGVTRRFPTLKFQFLECGTAWGGPLFSDLIGHWEKRNRETVQRYNPAKLDRKLYTELLGRYGGPEMQAQAEEQIRLSLARDPGDQPITDEWAACGIEKVEDIRDLFVPNFYFGCEADDPMNAMAFNRKLLPMGVRLNAMFSSDIGHWDVPDISEVLEEAYELVEDGHLTEDDFRAFTFGNTVKLLAGTNPDFFKGTVLEHEVARELASMQGVTGAGDRDSVM